MSLQFGSTKIGAMQYNGQAISEAMYNGQTVYTSGLPVVHITGTTTNGSRDQFRAACVAHGTTYQTVVELPFALDTSASTRTSGMFNGCLSLTHVPEMDTSNVTNMSDMFRNCLSLAHVPDLETSNVTSATYMFDSCPALTDGNVRLIGKHPSVSILFMIRGSGLTREPFFDAAGNPI